PSPSPILASYPSHSSLSLSLSLSAASEGSRRASSPARVADERGSSISCPHPPAVRAPSPSWAAGRGVNHKMELVNVVSGMDRVRVPTYKDKDVNWILVRDILWRADLGAHHPAVSSRGKPLTCLGRARFREGSVDPGGVRPPKQAHRMIFIIVASTSWVSVQLNRRLCMKMDKVITT
ncbi:unnamed protein product, partial [Urochloa humidicola]